MIDHLVHTNFKPVDKRDDVSSIYGWLRGETDKVPVVFDQEKPFGIVNERGLMRSRVRRGAKIDHYVVGTKTLTSESPLDQLFDVIADSRIPYVPVTAGDGKKVKGYVTAADALLERDIPRDVQVAQVMQEVPVVKTTSNVGEVIHWFRDIGPGVLPVVNGNGGITGVVRRRQLMHLVMDARPSGRKPANGDLEDPRDTLIEGFVEHDYEVARPNAHLVDVRQQLAKFGALIVEDANGNAVGVVTPEGAVQSLVQHR